MKDKVRFLEKLTPKYTETHYHGNVVSFVFEEMCVEELIVGGWMRVPCVELFYFYHHIEGMPYRVVGEVEKRLRKQVENMAEKYLHLNADLRIVVLRNPS